MRFNGPGQSGADTDRLTAQYVRIFELMEDNNWRTLDGIAAITDDPPASVSAQLRHMRKKRNGSHTVDRRHVARGLHEYRLTVNTSSTPTEVEE